MTSVIGHHVVITVTQYTSAAKLRTTKMDLVSVYLPCTNSHILPILVHGETLTHKSGPTTSQNGQN